MSEHHIFLGDSLIVDSRYTIQISDSMSLLWSMLMILLRASLYRIHIKQVIWSHNIIVDVEKKKYIYIHQFSAHIKIIGRTLLTDNRKVTNYF